MATTEQFSLRWNNFHSNITTGFHELLENSDLVDVTLAVEGQYLQAHKLVLSICSPYFKQMFKLNPCKHPIVILKDVAHDNLKDILDFMYMGEVNILREKLPSFLRTAELLQVKGLTSDDSQSDTSSKHEDKFDYLDYHEENDIYNEDGNGNTTTLQMPQKLKRAHGSRTNMGIKKSKADQKQTNQKLPPKENHNDYKTDYVKQEGKTYYQDESPNFDPGVGFLNNVMTTDGSGQEQGVDREEKLIKSFYKCLKCTKIFTRRDHLRTHDKNIHGEDAGPFYCDYCSHWYKNAESLRKHAAKFHKKFHY